MSHHDRDVPPMDPGSDEADERQLRLAREQGDAFRRAVEHMVDEVAQTGGMQEAGDVVVGFAIEEAEGMYELRDGTLEWMEPGDENLHLEVVVMDGADNRFVPNLHVEAEILTEDGTSLGTHDQPLLWHPMIHHYGRNWVVPGDGTYTIRVHIDAPEFPRHDEVNGQRYAEPVDVEFADVRVETGQD